jgi:hypothetical protein
VGSLEAFLAARRYPSLVYQADGQISGLFKTGLARGVMLRRHVHNLGFAGVAEQDDNDPKRFHGT